MDFVAKVAFRGGIKGYDCKDEQGKDWNLKLSKARQVMFTFDCKIDTPIELTKVPKSFADRAAEIIEESDNKYKAYQKGVKQKELERTKHLPVNYNKHNKLQNPFDRYQQNQMEREFDEMDEKSWNDSFSGQKKLKKDMSEDERYWDFTIFLLRLGEPMAGDTVENALEDSQVAVVAEDYVNRVLVMYPALFEKYWDVFGEINTESFMETTGEVYSILENFDGMFDAVAPLLMGIELMTSKMAMHG